MVTKLQAASFLKQKTFQSNACKMLMLTVINGNGQYWPQGQ